MSTVVGLAVSGKGDTCSTSSNPTPAPNQGLYQPTGLAVDSSNNLYIADSKHNCVRMLPNGSAGVAFLTTVAGTCGSGPSTTPSPNGLVLDAANNLYISIQDTEVLPAVSTYQVLRQTLGSTPCVMAGATSTLVTNVCPGVTGSVALNAPSGLAISAMGDLLIADTGNNCVRQIAHLTTYNTAVGHCANDGSGNPATALNKPYGLTFSPTQSLFITETSPDNVVSYNLGSASLTIVAGLPNGASGPYSPAQDGISALSTPLNSPRGIAVDSFGNFSLADSGNSIARKLSGNVALPLCTTVGSASAAMPLTFVINQTVNLSASSGPDFSITSNTCLGPLVPAPASSIPNTCQVFVRFNPTRPGLRSSPVKLTDSLSGGITLQGLEAVATGPLSVFTPGIVNTVAGSLAAPAAVAVDSIGNAYVAEIWHYARDRRSSPPPRRWWPRPKPCDPARRRPAQSLSPCNRSSLETSSIADSTHGTVSRYGADGSINTGYFTGLDTPTAIYADGFDNLFIAQAGSTHNVIEVTPPDPAVSSPPASSRPAALPSTLMALSRIADAGGHLVYALDKSGILHEVAGNGTTTTTVPGQATGTAPAIAPVVISVAALPAAISTSPTPPPQSRLHRLLTSTTSNGSNIATVFGTGTAGNTGDGGPSNLAQVNDPVSIAVDGSANLFVADRGNNSIREVAYPSPTIAFGTVMVGQSSPAFIQGASNFGTDNLNLTAPLSISDPHFTVDSNSTNCGTTILAGSTCNLGLIFTPTANGPVTGTVSIVTNSYCVAGNSNSPEQQLISPLQFTLPHKLRSTSKPFLKRSSSRNGSPAPTGTITFLSASKSFAPSPRPLTTTTTCNAPNSGLAVSIYTVTFAYTGDTNYAPATSTVADSRSAALTVINNLSRSTGHPIQP